MEARSVDEIPVGEEWQYEPKWDGFRCLAFRDRDDVHLRSKAGQPLARYFPDVVSALAALKAKRFVLDGELVIPVKGALSFNRLLKNSVAKLRTFVAYATKVRLAQGEYRAGVIPR